MVREKIAVSTRTRQWKCVESRKNIKIFYYGRFVLSPEKEVLSSQILTNID